MSSCPPNKDGFCTCYAKEEVDAVDGHEDFLLIGYIDRSKSKTKSVKKSVKRIYRRDVNIEGNDNYVFSITKIRPAVKSTRKVTNM